VYTPQVPGKYTVTATFAGTKGYWPSSSENSFDVMSAPSTTTATPTATPAFVADLYFVPAIAGIFVLIVAVAIVLALLMLRKRPINHTKEKPNSPFSLFKITPTKELKRFLTTDSQW
jgi:hypothetical protein